jgi:hypothetical protein
MEWVVAASNGQSAPWRPGCGSALGPGVAGRHRQRFGVLWIRSLAAGRQAVALACRLRRLPLAGEQVLVLRGYSTRRVRTRTDTCLHRRLTTYMQTCGASRSLVCPMGDSQTA